MATPITQYSVPTGYPANGLPAPTYPDVPQAKWPTPNYYALATQSVTPYGYPYNMSAPRSAPNQFGPQGAFSPGYHPYAFNAPPQYFQQPYPQASQPMIQYIPVVRQPVKPPEASSPPILN